MSPFRSLTNRLTVALVAVAAIAATLLQAGTANAEIGVDQNVHFANSTGQDVYAIAAPNPAWKVADLGVDAALFAVGIGEIRAGLTAVDVPATITTFADLIKVLSVSSKILSGTISAGSRSAEGALAVAEIAKKEFPNQKIGNNQEKNIWSQGFLSTYLSVSGIAGLANASTVTVLAITADGKKTVQYNTGPDQSWIAKSDGIYHAKYGSLWQIDGGVQVTSW